MEESIAQFPNVISYILDLLPAMAQQPDEDKNCPLHYAVRGLMAYHVKLSKKLWHAPQQFYSNTIQNVICPFIWQAFKIQLKLLMCSCKMYQWHYGMEVALKKVATTYCMPIQFTKKVIWYLVHEFTKVITYMDAYMQTPLQHALQQETTLTTKIICHITIVLWDFNTISHVGYFDYYPSCTCKHNVGWTENWPVM